MSKNGLAGSNPALLHLCGHCNQPVEPHHTPVKGDDERWYHGMCYYWIWKDSIKGQKKEVRSTCKK